MTTTAEQMRAWSGTPLLSFGFRPFFLGASVWAALSMVLWVMVLSGTLSLPTAFDPVSWHAHEFLFGYLGAVIGGFLLTAVPNWTGRLPIVGERLGLLAALWLAGRAVVALSALFPAIAVALVDLAFPVGLIAAIGREIVSGKNWRNLPVLGMLGVFTLGNAFFHLEAALGGYAAQGIGLRTGVAAGVMMVGVIGGRIVPSFTRNWLVKRKSNASVAPPMKSLDKVTLLLLAAALLLWIVMPIHPATGGALVLVGALHLVRLARWAGHRTLEEPLVTVLHVGYLFVPFGALALGIAILAGSPGGVAAAQHLWMAGAFGLMTLAVMTRATLGHTGRELTADGATIAIYALVLISVAMRCSAIFWPDQAMLLFEVAGMAWIAAFAGFAGVYGRMLLGPKRL